ncbi:metal ABC transporter permease [Neisseria sp. Ec49-e6-T10]|uniref:metal ABC transporter permease n=1 Tax=Neisseria sp. Ec49-e6-T10 TaxID=3140744 RepID=UPI003EB6CFB0
MNTLYLYFIEPFVEFSFMRYALASCFCLSISSAPIGVFLVMRRMSLMGDAMSHAVLPGAAIGYIFAGLSLPYMSIGGFIAGVLMAIFAGLASRFTTLKEDANFAAFYLTCLALGVLLVSMHGGNVDLLNLLFGSVLGVDKIALLLVTSVATISLTLLAIMYRPLMLESIDPVFLKAVNGKGGLWHVLFLMLVVINLVAGFQALGTLMSVGLMMLPAITARLWVQSMGKILLLATLIALLSATGGLLLSYHHEYPSGPAIILLCGCFYLFSLLFGQYGGVIARYFRTKHHVN